MPDARRRGAAVLVRHPWRCADHRLRPTSSSMFERLGRQQNLFAHQIAVHDDAEVFRSGLDLLLAGLRRQAEEQA